MCVICKDLNGWYICHRLAEVGSWKLLKRLIHFEASIDALASVNKIKHHTRVHILYMHVRM